MSKYSFVSILYIFALCENVLATNLPDFINTCHRNNPYLNVCVSKMIESIKPYLEKGIPELDIPRCEPLVVPEIILNQGQGPLSLQSKYKDIHIWGPSNFTIKNSSIDLNENIFKLNIYVPELYIKANYEMKGNILIMPISGKGVCHGNYSKIHVNITMNLDKIDVDGDEYFHCKDLDVDFKIKDAKVQFDDLFDGNAIIGTAMNMFLNENKNIIIEELKPILEDVIADLFQTFANGIFGKYPINKLFID